MNKIAKYLNKYLTGAAYDSPLVLAGYATDNSVLKITPKTVTVPRTTKDIRRIARFSSQLASRKIKLPITPRGTGQDKTGASIGAGIIVSLEEMNQIQEIDTRQKLVRVQAGVRLDQLNSALALHGLVFPFEDYNPAQTIGGLIATTSPTRLYPYISQAEIVLSSGDVIQTEHLRPRALEKKKGEKTFEGEIYRNLHRLLSETDLTSTGTGTPNLSGYPGITAVQSKNKSFDLLPLFFASQGTLGIITEVILSCETLPEEPAHLLIAHKSANAALDFATEAHRLQPSEIQIFDVALFHEAATYNKTLRLLNKLPENGILTCVTFTDPSRRKRAKKLKKLTKLLPKSANFAISSEENLEDFQELNSIISLYMNGLPRATRPPIVDDAFIPDPQLKEYFIAISKLEEKHKIKLPVYGSLTRCNYTIRPEVDLGSVRGRQFILSFLREYGDIVTAAGGNLTGSTPEGRLKALYANLHLDPSTASIYEELKKIFDPEDLLNPGIKQQATLRQTVRQLRTTYNPGLNKS